MPRAAAPAFEAAIDEDSPGWASIGSGRCGASPSHMADYSAARERLRALGVLLSLLPHRQEIAAEIAAAANAPMARTGRSTPHLPRPAGYHARDPHGRGLPYDRATGCRRAPGAGGR